MSKETTHIRIEKDLKQALEEQAGPDESINDVIRRLLTSVNSNVNQNVNCDVNTWQDAIQALTARVERLEQDRQIQPEVTPVPDQQESTQPPRVDESTMHEACHLPGDESIPGNQEDTQASHEVEPGDRAEIETGIPDRQEKITITEEVREALIHKIETLEARGMRPVEIASAAGFNRSLITKIRKSMDDSNRAKTITRLHYNSLMVL